MKKNKVADLILDLKEAATIVSKVEGIPPFTYISTDEITKMVFREIRTRRMLESFPEMMKKILKEKDPLLSMVSLPGDDLDGAFLKAKLPSGFAEAADVAKLIPHNRFSKEEKKKMIRPSRTRKGRKK